MSQRGVPPSVDNLVFAKVGLAGLVGLGGAGVAGVVPPGVGGVGVGVPGGVGVPPSVPVPLMVFCCGLVSAVGQQGLRGAARRRFQPLRCNR